MALSRYKNIIWDWNGTLLDDAWLCLDIINEMLTKRGLPNISYERYREIFTFPVRNYYDQLEFDYSREKFEEISTEFITQYERRRQECILFEAADVILKILRRFGIKQTLLSASKQDYLSSVVRSFNIQHYFSSILGLNDHHADGKSVLAREWFSKNSIAPQQVLFIGDTVHDFDVAKSLGFDCVLINHGHQEDSLLKQCKVQVIERLEDVLTVLDHTTFCA